jgi:rhodanese-related sulfurtransferase/predicted metal-dependent enzyme (double-stranded beta helix superfamily)
MTQLANTATPTDLLDRRSAAVEEMIDRVREIERRQGVTRPALAAIERELIHLASRSELFPKEQFAIKPGKPTIYRLAEDPDNRFALYASAGALGKYQPPHNHTTWAVIAGVHGNEHNVMYERCDDRSVPGQGKLRKTGERTVERGVAVSYLPDDFHTIQTLGNEEGLHLHLYGLSLEHLPDRIGFKTPEDTAYERFMRAPNIGAPLLPAHDLKAMISDGGELAILDVREEGVFSRRHLLFASSLPLSRLELRIDALVPRRSTRIVLCDGDDGLAQRAAARLMNLGYRNLAILDGGVEAWGQAGFEVFSGTYVPSKAFGEFVEHEEETPRMEAAEIKALVDQGRDVVILDSRPLDEFRKMSIPGGIDCPGAELVHRAFGLVRSPDALVVVNCAGRTRSIIGAQSLINAGMPNKVVALKNGTMGWHLAGLKLAHGETRMAPLPMADGLWKAMQAAERVAKRFGVRSIGLNDLARFETESGERSLYVFDVRSPEEYRSGHRPGSRSAPGGQLVQATDSYAATRNARLVLIDDNGVRATMTASWLIQMGWDEVYVLDGGLDGPLEIGLEPRTVLGLAQAKAPWIDPHGLRSLLDAGEAVVVDLDTSLRFRERRIPGAVFGIRSRLKELVPTLPKGRRIVLTSGDGLVAKLAADEVRAMTESEVAALLGGTEAWIAAGLPTQSGADGLPAEPDDVWYRPYDRTTGVEEAMKEYLSWELDLVRQIARDGDTRFRTFPATMT